MLWELEQRPFQSVGDALWGFRYSGNKVNNATCTNGNSGLT